MKPSLLRIALLLACPLLLRAAASAPRSTAEILPPARRQVTIKLAEDLLARTAPPPIAADLPSPFNPPDFDKPDPSEIKAGSAGLAGPAGPAAPGGPNVVAKPPATDRSILEAIAARIPVTGTMTGRDGKPILTGSNGKRFSVGNSFTVSYDNQDYDLEVVAIDRTTFTLRYRGEEITRNIRQK